MDNMEYAVRNILAALGENVEREGLINTPKRVCRMYEELCSGLTSKAPAMTTFQSESDEMVILTDIPFCSLCEHHLLPFIGTADIGYLPDQKMVGLSKIPRILDWYARRPQVQERLTGQVADHLHRELRAKGVGVILKAEHACMSIRGIQKPGVKTITSAMRGIFLQDQAARGELMKLIRSNHG